MEETNTNTVPETNSTETAPQETEPAKSAESTPAEKTFTQKELDDIVKQRLDRVKNPYCVEEDALGTSSEALSCPELRIA